MRIFQNNITGKVRIILQHLIKPLLYFSIISTIVQRQTRTL